MSKSQIATTAYGETEYETTTCKHCESDVLTDESIGVVVGTTVSNDSFSGSRELSHGETYNVCPVCADVLFGYSKRGVVGDYIPTGWNAIVHRVVSVGDPIFAGLFGLVGAFLGLLLFVSVMGIIGLF